MKTAFVSGDIIALSTAIFSAQGFLQSTICANLDELPNPLITGNMFKNVLVNKGLLKNKILQKPIPLPLLLLF